MGDIQVMESERWIVRQRQKAGARLRLFCFPYAGGAASIFYPWRQALPEFVEVCPIQLPGRENRFGEPLFNQLNQLTPVLTQVIQPYLDMPFAFFGHSLGALLGFELARDLRRQNLPLPFHLFASGTQAPQLPRSSSKILHQLPDNEFLESIKGMNGTHTDVFQNVEFSKLFLPILRADFALVETYTYINEPPLPCSISALGGDRDPLGVEETLSAWQVQTRTRFKLHIFPGDHFFLNSARTALLKTVSDELNLFSGFFASF